MALDRALLGGPSTSPLERVKPLAALPVLTLLAVGAPEAADVSPLLPSDREILQIVLEDFARSPDSVQYNRESPHTYVAVDADSTACRARIPRDVGPVFHGKPGHRSTVSRAG